MVAVDHLFALSMPAFVSAPFKKIVLHRELSDLRVEFLYLLFVARGLDRIASEYIFCACNQAPFPILDLIGVNIELLAQLSQGVVALYGRRCYFLSNRRGLALASSHTI